LNPVPRNSFELRAILPRDRLACQISGGGNDFDPLHARYVEGTGHQRPHRAGGNALALRRLFDPIAQIADKIPPVNRVQRRAAQQFARCFREYAQLDSRLGALACPALLEPRKGVRFRERGGAPWHPAAHGIHRFPRRASEISSVARAKTAKNPFVEHHRWHCPPLRRSRAR